MARDWQVEIVVFSRLFTGTIIAVERIYIALDGDAGMSFFGDRNVWIK